MVTSSSLNPTMISSSTNSYTSHTKAAFNANTPHSNSTLTCSAAREYRESSFLSLIHYRMELFSCTEIVFFANPLPDFANFRS